MKFKFLFAIALVALGFSELFADPVDDLKKFLKEKDYIQARGVITAATTQKPKDEDVFVMAGDVYFELAMPDSAVVMYEKAYKLDDDDNNIRRKLAKAYSEVGKHDEAIDIINKAIKDEKNNVLNNLALGQAYLKKGDLNKADLEIRKAQKMNEKLPAGWIALADLYYAQRVYSLAVDNYKKALELEETNIDARINLASSMYQLARQEEDKELKNEYYNQSLNQWEIVANKDPKNAKAFWEAGRIYYLAEAWENAAIYLNKYVQLRTDHSIARYYLVEALYNVNACEPLIENARIVAQEIDSVKSRVMVWSAECLYKTQKFAEAVEAYKACKADGPLTADHLENLSNAYFLSGDTLTAIKSYADVVAVDKNRPSGLMRYGTLAINMKDYESAINYLKLRNEVVQDSLTPKIKYYLGLSYIFAEKFEEATVVFEEAINEDPTNYSSYIYVSDAYVKLNDKEKAKAVLETVIGRMASNVAENTNSLNTAYQKLCAMFLSDKKFKEMNATAKSWTDLMPNSQPAFFFYALSYHGQGDQPNACRNYKKVISIDAASELGKNARKYTNDLKCN